MHIPFKVIYNSWIPRLFRHDYWTCWPFICCRGSKVGSRQVFWHEYAHLVQQVWTAVGVVTLILLTPIPEWFLLFIHPLPYLSLYCAGWVLARFRYSKNPFEVHAVRYGEDRKDVPVPGST